MIFALLVLSGFIVANLPYRYIQGGGMWIGVRTLSQPWSRVDPHATPVMAGWPFRYQIAYEFPDRVEQRWWSPVRCGANVLTALAIAAAVYAGTQYRRRKIETASDPKRLRVRFDVGVALAMMLVPMLLWALAIRSTWNDLRLARRVSSTGSCFLAWQLPEPLAHRLPASFERSLRRIRRVHLDQPTDDLVRQTVRVPTLVEYHLNRGRYGHELLEPLRRSHHLAALSITSKVLDRPLMQVIGEQRWVRQISLKRTNLDQRLLRGLDSLSSLRDVDLTGTPLKLRQLGKPAWAQTVRTLWLSRPPSGQSDCLKLNGWPRLRHLAVRRPSIEPNDETLELRLSDLPQLRRLVLDRIQKHALVARRLPRLLNIIENFEYVARNNAESAIPGGTWFSELKLDCVPSLSRISCFTRHLESLEITACPQLRHFTLTPFSVRPMGGSTLERVDSARCQQWIDGLGRGDGPATLHLEALPLSEVDLAPLRNNPGIRHLKLSHSGVGFEQVQSLVPMRQLRSLEIADCPVTSDQFDWVLNHFPKLEQLRANLENLQRLEIAGNEQLEELGENRVQQLHNLRILDVPHLKCGIHMVDAPRCIEIRNAPRLTGLAVEGPWPKNATVRGIRKLRWFAAGGPEVDDQLVNALLDCDGLDQLTLAYGSVSRDNLIALEKFLGLTRLALPGADVDDSVTDHWRKMAQLREINLDDTAVSTSTFAWLSRLEGLRQLSIKRLSLDKAACRALSRLTQLAQLDLDGTPVPPSTLEPILAAGLIEKINLSGHRCSPELVKLLSDCDSLRTLVWHRADIDEASLRQLLAANPDLHIETELLPLKFAADLVAELDMRRRRALDSQASPLAWVAGFDFAFTLPMDDRRSDDSSSPVFQGASKEETLAVSRSAAFVRDQRTTAGHINVHRFRP